VCEYNYTKKIRLEREREKENKNAKTKARKINKRDNIKKTAHIMELIKRKDRAKMEKKI
jgi:hypothetical protein